jgi:hypothetical protein
VVSNCSYSHSITSFTDTIEVCEEVYSYGGPYNQSIIEGDTAVFYSSAIGTNPKTYQWYRNNIPIPGATNYFYSTPPLSMSDSGSTYFCIITNCHGLSVLYSDTATLTILPISVEEVDGFDGLISYPNPSTGEVFISCQEKILHVRALDVRGRVVYASDKVENKISLTLERGFFFVEVQTRRGTAVLRIVIVD